MEAPTLDDTMPDNERLVWALEALLDDHTVILPHYPMAKLPKVLRDSDFTVKVIGEKVEDRFTIYDIRPVSDTTPLCAVGIDIGTTTVSAVLFDLTDGKLLAKASGGNGQIRKLFSTLARLHFSFMPLSGKLLQFSNKWKKSSVSFKRRNASTDSLNLKLALRPVPYPVHSAILPIQLPLSTLGKGLPE